MAVDITPLGFKAPDGNDPVRNGDNHIADNARKADELHAAELGRLTQLEASAGFSGTGLDLADAVVNPLLDTATTTRNKLDARYATKDSPAFTGTPTGITKAHVGLSSVDNTSDAAKPVSTATAAAIASMSNANSISGFVSGSPLTVYGHSYTPVPGYYVPPNTGEWSSKIAQWTGMVRTSYGVSSTRMIENVSAAIGTQMPGATGNRSLPAGTKGVVVIESQMNDALMGPNTTAGRAGFKHAVRAFLAIATASQRIEATTATATGPFAGTFTTTRASNGSVRFAQGLTTDAPYLEFTGVSSPTGKVHILTLANAASSPTGTLNVAVNGVDQGIAYVGQGQMESFTSVVTGGGTYDYSPAIITVTVPTTGTFTIRVTRAAGGASATAYVDALLIPSTNPPIVLVCKDPAIGPYASQANQDAWVANSAALGNLMGEAVNEFPSARLVDLAPGWDPATMVALTTDGAKFHPNETGMEHIAGKVIGGIREEISKRISPTIGLR